jgi:dihydrodipicolinate synthase/N-acetylneuraminate lyase
VRRGSAGSINGLSGCRPELFVALRTALAAGDAAEAERLQGEITVLKTQVKAEQSTVAAVKRRVRERLGERGVDYPAAPRAPFA